MKKFTKRVIVFFMAAVMVVTAGVLTPSEEVKAASSSVYINPFSPTVVTYKTDDGISQNYSVISIVGCSKKSEIKNLKNSNSSMKVEKRDGYLVVYYGDKAQKTTITCTVKGVKLKTTFTVKKYTNPLKTLKLGKTNLTSKFDKTVTYKKNGKNYKNQTLQLQVKSGWKITSVYVCNNGKTSSTRVNGTKYSKKITLTGTSSYVQIFCQNEKSKIEEVLYIQY